MTDTSLTSAPVASDDWNSTLKYGFGSVFVVLFGLILWLAMTKISAAVVAPGVVAVETNKKTVQHLEGGIIAEILVRDGVRVQRGDTLVKLDATKNTAAEQLLNRQLAIALALETRLLSQANRQTELKFPSIVLAQQGEPLVADAITDNERQFQSRLNALHSAMNIINQQIKQAESDRQQAIADNASARQLLATNEKELPVIRDLFKKGLSNLARLTALERTQQQAESAFGKSEIDLKRSDDKIAEFSGRIEQLNREYVQEAASALVDVRKMINDYTQQLVVARDSLRRIDIVAPVTGTVLQLRFFTTGGVIKAGDPILDIVPDNEKFFVKAKVSPVDVDRVHQGAAVEIRLPQFSQYESQTIKGHVRVVGSDTVHDDASKKDPHYEVEVESDKSTIPAEIAKALRSGMTADVIIATQDRTALEYVVSPIFDEFKRSLRER